MCIFCIKFGDGEWVSQRAAEKGDVFVHTPQSMGFDSDEAKMVASVEFMQYATPGDVAKQLDIDISDERNVPDWFKQAVIVATKERLRNILGDKASGDDASNLLKGLLGL